MSQKKYRQPLDLNPRFSPTLFIVLLLVHLLAASALLLPLNLAGGWRILIFFAVVYSAWFYLYKNNIRKIKKACWRMTGELDLERLNGTRLRTTIVAGSVVSEWLVILLLADCTGRKHSWLILPDMIDRETYRRVCVRLRQWHRQRAAST